MRLSRRDLIKSFIGALGISLIPKYIEHKSQIDELFIASMEKYKKEIIDNFFQVDPLFIKLVEETMTEMNGGNFIQEPFTMING